MKALVIGGTKGFGAAVVDKLQENGYEVITVGRSGGDYNIDVGDEKAWQTMIDEIASNLKEIDVAVFVTGYARASDPASRSNEDWQEHYQKNVGYIKTALAELDFSPNAKIVTLGSQWSYKKGAVELEPYIQAKHELKELTKSFAKEHPNFSVVHIAAPPMKTPQRELVWEKFGEKPETKSKIELTNPALIAETLVNDVLEKDHHGEALQIDSHGKIKEILDQEIRYETEVKKR